jgi:NADH dehydrogenase FAD-containing subunit
VLTDSAITEINEHAIMVNHAKRFPHALLVWSAGVKTADYIHDLSLPKNPQGRLRCDRFLQMEKACFVAGDAALFQKKNTPLRMSIQFAISEGECAAKNILRAVAAKPLKAFKPADPGFIIPLANNRACGLVFGLPVKGITPVFLHFFLCLHRLYGISNKWHLLIELIRNEFKKDYGRGKMENGFRNYKPPSSANRSGASPKGIVHTPKNEHQ